ncbi:hypothetical protein AVEN_19186-1 [Araneus ventricosus]|uniref:Uncharacterized protein n=1 Tax=Araneus ventricosus TaxID=182803 RepID=A0A4Y2X2Y3_ARAVE|nr:hypothetical protein AVEN_259125-1 [Araneus ventricosus]GBO43478.1 hypothetical protein AVEN_19186-1 [Araneus ventricosus]
MRYVLRTVQLGKLCDPPEAVANANLIQHALLSGEAAFHYVWHVKWDNCKIYAEMQPNSTREWQRDTPKANVWLGMTKSEIYMPFIFA